MNFILGVVASTFVLTGCSSNEDALASVQKKSTLGYEVLDGTVKFENYKAYDAVCNKMYEMSYSELENWRSALKISSLYDSYINQIVPIDSTKAEIRIGDNVVAMLLNNKGILIVGDTTINVIDGYVYKVPTKDVKKLEALQTNPENWKDLGIRRFKHTNYFVESSLEAKTPVGMQKFTGTKDQEDGYVYDYKNGKYRRQEKVILSAFSEPSISENGSYRVGAGMRGVARNKDVAWGTWWGSWFNDEIYYGKISINSGQYVAGWTTFSIGPLGGIISPNTTGGSYSINTLYQPDVKTMNVTYEYQKSSNSTRMTNTIVWN